jgi:xylose isomerase
MQLRAVFVTQIKLVGHTIKRELDCADVLGLLASQIVDQRDYRFLRHQ